jgi:hypothetical protein
MFLSFNQIYPFADLPQCEKNIFLGEKNKFAWLSYVNFIKY